ncbi:MAG: TonB-dependent receptor domain-containing protein [Sphingomonadaceae bacterium]
MIFFANCARGSVSVAAVAAALMATPAMAEERSYAFSIPSQDMRTSLRVFSRVTGQQITYEGNEIRGRRAPALSGSFTAREGIQRLLSGSGLVANWGKSGVIVVRKGVNLADASAQEDQPGQDTASSAPVQEITVTGTRIARKVATDTPVPVVAIGIDDIEASGATELSEVLVDYPAVTTDSNLSNTVNNINAAGLSTVDLRDLGADRTLTLIDGRRTVSNRLTRNTVSLSTIPTMFVQNVEIITGGASAVYGSDAIAGVVNIITRDSYDGLKVGGRAGISSEGDSPRYNLDALWGGNFLDDTVKLVIGASYENEDGLKADQRPRALETISYSQTADLDPNNQGDLGIDTVDISSTPPGGRFLSSSTSGGGYFVYDNDGNLYQTTDLATYGYNSRLGSNISIPRESWLAAAKLTADLTSDIQFFSQVQYSRIDTFADRGYLSASDSSTYGVLDEFRVGRISRNNPLVPAEIRARASSSGVQWRRRFVEMGPYGSGNRRETWRGWAGLKGKLGSDWRWEVSYGYGRFHQVQDRSALNLQNLQFALDAEYDPAAPGDLSRVRCVDATARANGCVPLNVFGPGAVTEDATNYVRTNMHLDGLTTQNVVSGYVSGEMFQLPAGPASLAAGLEYRRDWQRSITDDVTRLGLGSSSFIAEYEGNVTAKEAFAEVSLPVLKDQPFAYELTVEAAARLGDYNIKNVGKMFSYRFGTTWSPTEGLMLRGQYARAQRAPTVTNLYSPLRDDSDSAVDPCDGVTATTTGVIAENCRSIPAIAAQITALGVFNQDTTTIKGPSAGNPDLKEETADTLTLGAAFTPRAVPGLAFTVDYFRIKVKDAIAALTADQLLEECYGNPDGISDNMFCDTITRDVDGQLVQIVNEDLNLNSIVRSGIDVALEYRFSAPDFISDTGKFDARLLYSRVLKYYTDFEGINGVTRADSKGEIGAWKNTGQFQLGYRDGPLRLRWKARYTGPGVDSNIRLANAQAAGSNPPFLHVGSRVRHDFYLSFDIDPDQTGDMRFYAGVNNAFNSISPFLPSGTYSGGSNNYSGSYDIVGRYMYAGFEVKF